MNFSKEINDQNMLCGFFLSVDCNFEDSLRPHDVHFHFLKDKLNNLDWGGGILRFFLSVDCNFENSLRPHDVHFHFLKEKLNNLDRGGGG
jgi:hypothetical protein